MYFPISGVEVSPWIPPLVAFGVSLFTSMGGVSGAFLILPFQVSVLHFDTPAVSPTNQLFNVVAIPSGVYRYIREGRMAWPLVLAVIIGTLPGVLIGAFVRVELLPDPDTFKLFVGIVLLYMGIRLLQDVLKKRKPGTGASAEEQFHKLVMEYHARSKQHSSNSDKLPRVVTKEFNFKRISYEFYGQSFDVSTPAIMGLSFIVGLIGGVYGIGGGAIIAPFFVSFLGLPVYTIAGATLMGTFVTSVVGVLFYQAIEPLYPDVSVAPDWALGLLFGVGGFAGMYLGARFQKFMPARVIKWILAFCILFTAIKYITDFI